MVQFYDMHYSHMYFYSTYYGQTVLPWLLSPFLREYHRYRLHNRGNYCGHRGITAIPIPMLLFNP